MATHIELAYRTQDAFGQLTRYGSAPASEDIVLVFERLTDLNDDLANDRDQSCVIEQVNHIREILDRIAPPAQEAADRGVLPPFQDEWAKKAAKGYQYGADALEQVHFGYRMAQDALTRKENGRGS